MTRILIADDHAVVRSGVRRILEDHPGWSVVAEATNGKDAVAEAIATKPDVAILDYALPVLNGIEATRQIRQRVPSVEVLIFTMHDNEDLLRESLNAGARGYVLKSDAQQHLILRRPALAAHKPFFTDRASQVLLENFLTKKEPDQAGPDRPRADHRSVGRRGPQQQAEREITQYQHQNCRDAPRHHHAQARPGLLGGIGALRHPQQFGRGLDRAWQSGDTVRGFGEKTEFHMDAGLVCLACSGRTLLSVR